MAQAKLSGRRKKKPEIRARLPGPAARPIGAGKGKLTNTCKQHGVQVYLH